MDKQAIEKEIINIFNLFRASIDKDFLYKTCKERGLLVESSEDNIFDSHFETVVSGLAKMAASDSDKFVELLDKYILWDSNIRNNYPAAVDEYKNQKVDLKKILKDVVLNPYRGRYDSATLDSIVQWVVVDLFTDLKQEGQAQEDSIFKQVQKKMEKGEEVKNIGGLLRERARMSLKKFFQLEKKEDDRWIKNIDDANDLREEIEDLEDSIKKEKDEKSLEKLKKKLEKKKEELTKVEKTLQRIRQNEEGGIKPHKGPELEKGQDPETLSTDPDSIMSVIDELDEKTSKQLEKMFYDFAMEKANPMGKRIMNLTIGPDSDFQYEKHRQQLKKDDTKPTRKNPRGLPQPFEERDSIKQLMKALKLTPDDYQSVQKGLDNIKELLIEFASKEKDVALLEHLENRRLLPKALKDRAKKEREEAEERLRKVKEKNKKQSSIEIKLSSIVEYLETLLKNKLK